MPNTLIQSKWDSGELVFHDADDYGVGAEILRISQDSVDIGTSTNDVTIVAYGDVTLYGDLDLADEDISVAVGKYIYLDGPTGNDYLRASTDNNVILNGQTTVKIGIAGTAEVSVSGTALYPETDDGQTLGILNTNEWSDLFLASAGVIGWNNSNCAITHAAGVLTVTGDIVASNAGGFALEDELASGTNPTVCPYKADLTTGMGWATNEIHFVVSGVDEVQITALILAPGVTNACALGSTSYYWSDLFIALEGVINFNADVTLTHAADLLTFAGGNLRMGTTDRLEFRDATEYMYSANDGYIDLVAATGFRVNTDVHVGENSAGHLVQFYGESSGSYLKWYGPTEDILELTNSAIQVLMTDDKTAGVNGIYSYIDTGGTTGWSSGNVVAGRFKVNVDHTAGTVSDLTAGWFGLNMAAGYVASQNGLRVGVNIEAGSAVTNAPTSILYLQSLPGTSADFSDMPYMVFSETRGGAEGTGSRYLFEVGSAPAGTVPTDGTGELFYESTLQIAVNESAGVRTNFFIPLSTAEASFTTDMPIVVTGNLTVGATGGSAGSDATFYGATSGATMIWDESEDYLVFAGAGRLEVGTFAVPISLDTFTGNEDIHGAMVSSLINAAMTSGEVARNIWSRMKITADQAQNVSIYGACLQCRVHTGSQTVDLTAGAYAGAWLYFEASDTNNVFTLDGATVAAGMATVEAAAGQALTTGSVYGIKINSAVNNTIDVSGLTSFSALYINGGSGKEDWTTGVEITDSAIGITIVQDTLANDGRSMKIDTTSATPTMSDGYGAFEINGNVSGAAVGWFSPLSSWINITGSGAAGAGDYMIAQQNGVYADSGGNTSATIIFGMRAQAQLTDAPGRLCPFSLNTANRSIDALFDIAAGPSAGLVNGSPGSTADGTIPIVIDAGGTIRYIHVYSDRN